MLVTQERSRLLEMSQKVDLCLAADLDRFKQFPESEKIELLHENSPDRIVLIQSNRISFLFDKKIWKW